MTHRIAIRVMGIMLVLAATAPRATAYIHFPPMTLQKMCTTSHHIRLLRVEKYNKEKGVIVFTVAESLKGQKSRITSFEHVLRAGAPGAKPILDWVKDGRTAVMFTIEGVNGAAVGLGYVFIDRYCYSVDYDPRGKYWLLIRGEPAMSACYHGSVEQLREIVRDILDGKDVKVPVKEPAVPEDRDRRRKEVNDVLEKNRR